VKVHTGHGANRAHNLYWRLGNCVWNNDGDTATLNNADRVRIDRCSYTLAEDPKASC
jgi:hypothetical protein